MINDHSTNISIALRNINVILVLTEIRNRPSYRIKRFSQQFHAMRIPERIVILAIDLN